MKKQYKPTNITISYGMGGCSSKHAKSKGQNCKTNHAVPCRR